MDEIQNMFDKNKDKETVQKLDVSNNNLLFLSKRNSKEQPTICHLQCEYKIVYWTI